MEKLTCKLEVVGVSTFDLLGYSMGGRTALSYALETQNKPRSLVLIGATPGFDALQAADARQIQDEGLADFLEQQGVEAFLKMWSQKPIIASQQRIQASWREAMTARRKHRKAHGLANSLRGMGTGAMPSLWHQLPELDIPVLLITGEEDAKFCAIAEHMLTLLPNAQHKVLHDAGHCAHLENPEQFQKVILDFWQTI